MSKANQNNKYIKIVVLHADTPDYNDIALTEHEIREIQANMQNLNFDIEHSHNYLDGISIKQNYISRTQETINNQTINKGSWIMVVGVNNQMVLGGITTGDIRGVSLETDFTSNMKVKPSDDIVVPYKDVETKEELIPHVISFTKNPANFMPLELMTHQQYTQKHITGGQNMTEKPTEEVNWLRNMIDKLTNTSQHTRKSLTDYPTTQPTMDQSTEELIQGLIESQKVIPTIAQSIEAVAESNAKMSEAFHNMSAKIDQLLVQNTTPEEEKPQEENTIETTEQNTNKSTTEKKPEEENNPENNEQDNQENNTDELTPEEKEQLKKLKEKEKHTRKNIQTNGEGLHPPTFTPLQETNTDEEEVKSYVANRTFDYFINGGK